MIVPDAPTEHVLTYRGNEYQQLTYKHAEYPANMWLIYRTVRYRPASLKYLPSFSTPADDKAHPTQVTW